MTQNMIFEPRQCRSCLYWSKIECRYWGYCSMPAALDKSEVDKNGGDPVVNILPYLRTHDLKKNVNLATRPDFLCVKWAEKDG